MTSSEWKFLESVTTLCVCVYWCMIVCGVGYEHTALATIHNMADEVFALIYAHSNCAMCVLSQGTVTSEAVQDMVAALEYIAWYKKYSADEAKDTPLEIMEHEKRLQSILSEYKHRAPPPEKDVGKVQRVVPPVDGDDSVGKVGKSVSGTRMMRRKKKLGV